VVFNIYTQKAGVHASCYSFRLELARVAIRITEKYTPDSGYAMQHILSVNGTSRTIMDQLWILLVR